MQAFFVDSTLLLLSLDLDQIDYDFLMCGKSKYILKTTELPEMPHTVLSVCKLLNIIIETLCRDEEQSCFATRIYMATTLFKGGLLSFQHNSHKRGVGKVIPHPS